LQGVTCWPITRFENWLHHSMRFVNIADRVTLSTIFRFHAIENNSVVRQRAERCTPLWCKHIFKWVPCKSTTLINFDTHLLQVWTYCSKKL